MPSKWTVPWSEAQVEALRQYQAAARHPHARHPYTCDNCSETLIPTTEGWTCSGCGYTQDWAHAIDPQTPGDHELYPASMTDFAKKVVEAGKTPESAWRHLCPGRPMPDFHGYTFSDGCAASALRKPDDFLKWDCQFKQGTIDTPIKVKRGTKEISDGRNRFLKAMDLIQRGMMSWDYVKTRFEESDEDPRSLSVRVNGREKERAPGERYALAIFNTYLCGEIPEKIEPVKDILKKNRANASAKGHGDPPPYPDLVCAKDVARLVYKKHPELKEVSTVEEGFINTLAKVVAWFYYAPDLFWSVWSKDLSFEKARVQYSARNGGKLKPNKNYPSVMISSKAGALEIIKEHGGIPSYDVLMHNFGVPHRSARAAASFHAAAQEYLGERRGYERGVRVGRSEVLGGHFAGPDEFLPEPTAEMQEAVLKSLKSAGGPVEIVELANSANLSTEEAEAAVHALIAAKYRIDKDGTTVTFQKVAPTGGRQKIRPDEYRDGDKIKIGIISDSHFGSKYARPDIVERLYDAFAEEGIRTVLHCGNYVDGFSERINLHELEPGMQSMDAQLDLFVSDWPSKPGMKTYFIDGDCHEGWWAKKIGVSVGSLAEMKAKKAGRDDLEYLGFMEQDVILPAKEQQTIIRMSHPGGGSSYAVSYKTQKAIESYLGGQKPQILLQGHYHKSVYMFERNVHAFQVGATQEQTPFMRKHNLRSVLGGWIIRFTQGPLGEVLDIDPKWLPFFDREFYSKNGRLVSVA